jgi:polyhydroxyalkanoate synthesis regulator phasin
VALDLPALPDNLDLLPRRDLVALCDGLGLLVRTSETAADLRERLVEHYADAARREAARVRYLRDEAYRKRIPAPQANPALDALKAGLWGVANLANRLDRETDVATVLYAALPTLAAYVSGKGDVTPEEARSAVTELEEALRRHARHVEEASGHIEWHLGDVSRIQQRHAATEAARREAQKAAAAARAQ